MSKSTMEIVESSGTNIKYEHEDDQTKLLNYNLVKLLECPVCFEICIPPIFSCVNGHHVCSSCKQRLKECSVCRVQGGAEIRCRLAEQMCKQLVLPCRFSKYGCDSVVIFSCLENHMKYCQYRYRCLVVLCEWQGEPKALKNHVEEKHGGLCRSDEMWCYENNFHQNHNLSALRLVTYDGELFWTLMKYNASSSTMFLYSRYVGPNENADKYFCEFRFRSDDGNHNYSFSAKTLGMDDDIFASKKVIRLTKFIINIFLKRDSTISFRAMLSNMQLSPNVR